MAKVLRPLLFQFGPNYSISLGSSNGLDSRPKETDGAFCGPDTSSEVSDWI